MFRTRIGSRLRILRQEIEIASKNLCRLGSCTSELAVVFCRTVDALRLCCSSCSCKVGSCRTRVLFTMGGTLGTVKSGWTCPISCCTVSLAIRPCRASQTIFLFVLRLIFAWLADQLDPLALRTFVARRARKERDTSGYLHIFCIRRIGTSQTVVSSRTIINPTFF